MNINDREWFIYGREERPYSTQEILDGIAAKAVYPNDIVFRDGFKDWVFIINVREFSDAIEKTWFPDVK